MTPWRTARNILLLTLSAGLPTGLLLWILLPAALGWLPVLGGVAAGAAGGMLAARSLWRHREKEVICQQEDVQFKDAIIRFIMASTQLNTREALYNLILETAVHAIPHGERGSLLKVVDGKFARFEAAYGHDMSILRNLTLRLEETFNHVLTDGRYDRTVIVRNYQALNREILDNDRYNLLEEGTADIHDSSIISAPVHVDGQLWGMLSIDSVPGFHFDASHIAKLDVFVNETVRIIRFFNEQEQNLWLMRHDPLTGLLNRPHFTERLLADLETAAAGTLHGIVVSMDLDNFKHINDTFGHLNGDQALIHFGEVFSGFLGRNDYLSRYGGDEFVAVFPNQEMEAVAQRMLDITAALVLSPLRIGDHGEIIRFSYGLLPFNEDQHDHRQIMQQSDALMYACKKTHRSSTP